jgi:hypothetical protein
MSGYDRNHSDISSAELKRWLDGAKPDLPGPSPAFREAVMASIRTRSRLQNLGTWQRMPGPTVWRYMKPVVVFFLISAAIYLAAGVPHALHIVAGRDNTLVTVRFTLSDARARDVRLAGAFSQWEPRHVMQRDARGVWTADIPLQPGRHEYMFVVDGHRWVTDPASRQIHNDGYGGKNSVVVVSTADGRKEDTHAQAI